MKIQVLYAFIICCFISSFISSSMFAQSINKRIPFAIGESIYLYSDILEEDRILNIYLPASYNPDSTKKYPVIYLLDGSKEEDFIHIAGIIQFGSYPWIDMISESIVVGIENVDRYRDFSYPSSVEEDLKKLPTSGKSGKFIEFMEKEVQTLIAQNYKVSDTKTLIGQSLGGLLASEILLKKPDLFDNYIIISPSLWWDDQLLLSSVPKDFKTAKSIYIAVGKEGKVMKSVAKKLYKKINTYAPKNTSVHFQYFKDLNHANILHLAVYDAFQVIFSD